VQPGQDCGQGDELDIVYCAGGVLAAIITWLRTWRQHADQRGTRGW
jgi:SH3-like domain-containing protein